MPSDRNICLRYNYINAVPRDDDTRVDQDRNQERYYSNMFAYERDSYRSMLCFCRNNDILGSTWLLSNLRFASTQPYLLFEHQRLII
jgi:hypothetical protein